MEKGDDIKGPNMLDRAKDEVVAITDTVHDTLHSVRKETEEKAEKLKGGLKHLLHKGPQFFDKAKGEIKDHLFSKNGEDNVETSPTETSIPVQVIDTNKEGETSSLVETSIPVQEIDTKEGETSSPAETSIPVQATDTKKEGENNFVAYFAQFFEKCCEPFNKKKD